MHILQFILLTFSTVVQLHVASCAGYLSVVEFLLSHNAAVNAVDNDGWQPLHCAVCWGQVSVFVGHSFSERSPHYMFFADHGCQTNESV